MKDILFVAANNSGTYRSEKIVSENLGIGILSAVVEERGFKSDLVDARLYNLRPQDAAKNIENYHVVGISIISFEAMKWVQEFITICRQKNRNVLIVLGGYGATLAEKFIIENKMDIDVLILGEGEMAIIDLLDAHLTGNTFADIRGIVYRSDTRFIKTKSQDRIINIENNPFPKRYAQEFADENFEVLIEGSRGCMNNCTFCAVKSFVNNTCNLQWRGRSAKSLINELLYLRKIYPNSKRIRFVDPDFFGSDPEGIDRVSEFCDLLEKNELRDYQFFIETRVRTVCKKNQLVFKRFNKLGLTEVYLGIESGSEYILKTMNKQITPRDSLESINLLRKWGIDFAFGFMMITPWSKYDDIIENLKFLSQIGDIQFDKLFHRLELIPTTPSVKLAEKRGLLKGINEKGYYEYEFESSEAKQIENTWNYLQDNHLEFLQEIWYLYKDLKTWKQAEGCIVDKYISQLSEISIKIFRELFECSQTNNISSENIMNVIIRKYVEELNRLRKNISLKYIFPRNKMPGGA